MKKLVKPYETAVDDCARAEVLCADNQRRAFETIDAVTAACRAREKWVTGWILAWQAASHRAREVKGLVHGATARLSREVWRLKWILRPTAITRHATVQAVQTVRQTPRHVRSLWQKLLEFFTTLFRRKRS